VNKTFAQAVEVPDERINLAEAALWIARDAYPDLDVGLYLARLDSLAASAAVNIRPGSSRSQGRNAIEASVKSLSDFLYRKVGFHGAAQSYYDPRNSYLNEVLDRRVGIPITLAVVYLEIGWRLGLPLEGVGLPGHFIVGWSGPQGRRFIDPFDNGRELDEVACEERLRTIMGSRVKLDPDWLRPVSRRYILIRILNNLKNALFQSGDAQRAIPVVENLLVLDPAAAEERRDLGLLFAHAGRRWDALKQLEEYLRIRPDAQDVRQIQALADRIFSELGDYE
jgi:regulator of sirC expression with transglutaminase-like and TPR domain